MQWPNGKKEDMDCIQDVLRIDPMMGQLEENGGPTKTIAPLPESPVIGAGENCVDTDQRGVLRKERCTLGAYEVTSEGLN